MPPEYGIDPFTRASVADAQEGIVISDPKRTKVAIIGAGDYRKYAPWDDAEWEFWGINEIFQKRATRWFELHPMAVQNARELAWLADCPAPCYVLDLEDCVGRVKHAVEYPFERMLEIGRRYFTCTFAFQIALAIAEGFEEIGLWGVDLDLGTPRERLVEKPGVEYWLGLAEGKGITVTLPTGATLLNRPWVYGYAYEDEKRQIEDVCDDLVLATPRARWPGILKHLERQYGGAAGDALVRAAAEFERRGPASLRRP